MKLSALLQSLVLRTDQRPSQKLIVMDLLLPHHRYPRHPLAKWAISVHSHYNRLKALNYSNVAYCHELIGCFNQLALIEAYFGRRADAALLCNAALKWIVSLVAHTGAAACYGAAFDPFVNLGRLDRLGGKPRDALAKFSAVRSALEQQPVSLGPVVLGRDSLQAALSDQQLVTVLREVAIVDPIKTMLRAAMYEDLVQFACDYEDFVTSSTSQFLWEACAVAAAGLGAFDAALQIVETYIASPRAANAAVFQYRRAEILVAAGQAEKATIILNKLSEKFAQGIDKVGRFSLPLLLALTRLFLPHDKDRCKALLEAGLRIAEHLDDVLYQCECLDLLRGCVSPGKATQIEESITRTKGQALYGAGARPDSIGAPVVCNEIGGIFQELLSFANKQIVLPSSTCGRTHARVFPFRSLLSAASQKLRWTTSFLRNGQP